MKKIFLLVLSCICYVSSIQSQSFNYQAVVRNAAGDLVTNQSIGVQIKLLRTGPSGPAIYTEIHTVSSSDQGVITLMIGYGTSEDVFVDLDWSSRNYWLEIAVDITGGTTYTVIGNSRLFSVPYANYALSGVFAKQADPDGGGNNISNTRVGATPIDEDFIFGSSQIQDIPGAEDDARMFFNKSRASFRAGSVEGNFWDYSNQGSYSAAFGIDNIASGVGSFVSGSETEAAGQYAIAMGDQSIAAGDGSITMGSFLTAESMAQISLGSNNTVVSGNVDEYILTDRLFVVGNGISAAQKSDALVILKNGNTTLNGQLTIDGDNTGIGTSYTLPAQDGTTNQVMSTDGSGNVAWVTTPASTGVLSTVANITSNAPGTIATDDFVFGSTQLANDINTTDDDKRIFFDKSKGAFRVGIAQSNEWNDTNVGELSIGLGRRATATGTSSVAIGPFANALIDEATAIGYASSAYGIRSVAIGFNTIAESREQITIGSHNTFATGDENNWVSTDRLFVIGNGDVSSDPTSSSRSDALVILKNGNTTLNGSLTIDGDNAGVGASYTLPAQDGTANQVMSTDGSGNVAWTTSASGGAFNTTSNVTSNASGDIAIDNFVFGSTQLANDINTSDDDKRMFFDKDNAAFRAGEAQDDEWDPINLGSNSAAFGINNIASGSSSFVAGDENQAIGFTATAIGVGNIANGSSSVTLGASLKAESRTQISLGVNNTPLAGNSFLHVATDRLFVIGNGIGITPSDALVILKNGNTTLNGSLTIDGDNAGAGASYTLPAQDGAANQVIVTDGSGNVSWADNTTTIEAYTAATLNIAAGWQYYNAAFGVSTFQDPRYRIVDNVVYLEGLVRKNAAIINGDTIMTLPTGYRPQKTRIFSVETENGTVRVDVNPNGTVIIATGFNVTQNWVSLDGITFSVD